MLDGLLFDYTLWTNENLIAKKQKEKILRDHVDQNVSF
jgi:hypothetical protein